MNIFNLERESFLFGVKSLQLWFYFGRQEDFVTVVHQKTGLSKSTVRSWLDEDGRGAKNESMTFANALKICIAINVLPSEWSYIFPQ